MGRPTRTAEKSSLRVGRGNTTGKGVPLSPPIRHQGVAHTRTRRKVTDVASFVSESVSEALERGIRNAKHLRAKHAPAVAAARALARKIDAWDVIVQWAIEDAAETRGARPSVPANDNVSIASFLKYLDALGLTPDEEPRATAGPGRPATLPPSKEATAPKPAGNKVLAFRQKARTAG